MEEISSDDARRRWRELLNAVEHDGEHVTVMRYGQPTVVIVPVDWYRDALITAIDVAEGRHD